jgi:hypothetical protein
MNEHADFKTITPKEESSYDRMIREKQEAQKYGIRGAENIFVRAWTDKRVRRKYNSSSMGFPSIQGLSKDQTFP